jgi:hypothetical protein
MKVEKKNTILLLYSWLPTETYLKNLANLGHFFSMENPSYRLKFGKISPKRRRRRTEVWRRASAGAH